MNNNLRNAVWNEVCDIVAIQDGVTGYGDATYGSSAARLLWTEFFYKRITEFPYAGEFLKKIEPLYDDLKEKQVFNLIEFLLPLTPRKKFFIDQFNRVLEKNNSEHKIIHDMVQPISGEEVSEIIKCAYSDAPDKETKQHLRKAQSLYSRKRKPDFNNSCLESVKAIEACCRSFFKNRKTLGDNIKKLKRTSADNLHIIALLGKINAFRNDVVAHATQSDGYHPDREDAILVHTVCCGFINYFKAKGKG